MYRILSFLIVSLFLINTPSTHLPVKTASNPGVQKNFNKNTFTPWDVQAASRSVAPRGHKPYTVLLYMNGSDLETEAGAATDDLIEILESGMDSRFTNFVILTGGTKRWQNDVIPSNECALWEIADGLIYEITGIGQRNMGDPGTLSSFIEFGLKNFPAEKYGLILWDHGGGSIIGYGHDEKYADGSLTLKEMKDAFERAGLRDNKLEFLGFDSCLMGSVEMAVVASDYANVMIASEDLEPGEGWDYSFLSIFNRGAVDGISIGVAIVDSFMAFYGPNSDEILSLSVTDLSQAGNVMDALGDLMRLGNDSLRQNQSSAFQSLARRRAGTITFGEGSPRDNESDMVDIGDMADKLSDLYPAEAARLVSALEKCVVYNRHNSHVDLKGLSTYYIYGGQALGVPSLNTYAALDVNEPYTRYLHSFFDALTAVPPRRRSTQPANRQIISAESVLWHPVPGKKGVFRMAGLAFGDETECWPNLNNRPVSLYPVAQSADNRQYAIPAEVNGRECDIIVLFNERYPNGLVEGARNREGPVIQKGYDPIEPGDKVALFSLELDAQLKTRWHKGRVFTVKDELELIWKPAGVGSFQGYRLTGIRGDETYTRPEPVTEAGDKAA
jgi:hypothetical protein